MIESVVQNDIAIVCDRAATDRQKRHVKSMLRDAKKLLPSAPSRSCIRAVGATCSGNGVKFKEDVEIEHIPGASEDMIVAAHWTDSYHEPHGTHPSLLVGASERNEDGDR